jgi:hypothetical protein
MQRESEHEFLRECFPTISEDELVHALTQAEGDACQAARLISDTHGGVLSRRPQKPSRCEKRAVQRATITAFYKAKDDLEILQQVFPEQSKDCLRQHLAAHQGDIDVATSSVCTSVCTSILADSDDADKLFAQMFTDTLLSTALHRGIPGGSLVRIRDIIAHLLDKLQDRVYNRPSQEPLVSTANKFTELVERECVELDAGTPWNWKNTAPKAIRLAAKVEVVLLNVVMLLSIKDASPLRPKALTWDEKGKGLA